MFIAKEVAEEIFSFFLNFLVGKLYHIVAINLLQTKKLMGEAK